MIWGSSSRVDGGCTARAKPTKAKAPLRSPQSRTRVERQAGLRNAEI